MSVVPTTPLLIVALAMALGTCRQPAEASQPELVEIDMPTTSPVVLELFTSEGCSSCPPADALLAELHAAHGDHLIALAYHVDYWDRLGWADPYGDPAYSQRQRAYARAGNGRVYTPQMIVGGTNEFVGSNRAQAHAAIGEANELMVDVSLTAQALGTDAAIEVFIAEAPEASVLHLALVQKATSTDVRRGENRGRRLEHVRVVRQLVTGPAMSGSHTLRLPDGLRAGDVQVVALVQDGPVGPMLGAAETSVQSEGLEQATALTLTLDSLRDTPHHAP
ncbi:MAG: DUF1223 domain-containing protein [Rubricoccaceae bacterium]